MGVRPRKPRLGELRPERSHSGASTAKG
jgi:hypothetical protein